MSIKELYSLFPITGDNLNSEVIGDNSHDVAGEKFPVTGDNFRSEIAGDYLPVTGDDLCSEKTGDNFPVTGDNLQSEVTGDNLQSDVTGDKVVCGDTLHFEVAGEIFPVIGENLNSEVTGDNFQISGENLHFEVTGDNFPVTGDNLQFEVTGENFPVTGDNLHSEVAGESFSVGDDFVPVKLNLTSWLEKLTLSLIVKMIAGKSYGRDNDDDEEAERFKNALKDFMYISMQFVLWDAFPIPLFKWIDFQGHVKFMKRTFKDIDSVLQGWLDEHEKKRGSGYVAGNEQDFIDVMLSTMGHEDFADGYSRETTIKATALSMVLVASDTVAIHLEWVMAALLNHKDAMKKVQEELDSKVGKNRWVEESDIKNLVYFQAVIKEALRIYPPVPLIIHESVEDSIVCGYHIPKGTRLFINLLKLQRDPTIWSYPDTFDPERFLTSQAGFDVRGQHYEFIPFGSGRRSCPGITYATQLTHLAIAHLLQGFDLSTPSNEPLDMKEGFGLSMRKVKPVEVLITPRLPSALYKF